MTIAGRGAGDITTPEPDHNEAVVSALGHLITARTVAEAVQTVVRKTVVLVVGPDLITGWYICL